MTLSSTKCYDALQLKFLRTGHYDRSKCLPRLGGKRHHLLCLRLIVLLLLLFIYYTTIWYL